MRSLNILFWKVSLIISLSLYVMPVSSAQAFLAEEHNASMDSFWSELSKISNNIRQKVTNVVQAVKEKVTHGVEELEEAGSDVAKKIQQKITSAVHAVKELEGEGEERLAKGKEALLEVWQKLPLKVREKLVGSEKDQSELREALAKFFKLPMEIQVKLLGFVKEVVEEEVQAGVHLFHGDSKQEAEERMLGWKKKFKTWRVDKELQYQEYIHDPNHNLLGPLLRLFLRNTDIALSVLAKDPAPLLCHLGVTIEGGKRENAHHQDCHLLIPY